MTLELTLTPTIRPATELDAESLTRIALSSKAFWGYSDVFMADCCEELTVTEEKINSERFVYYLAHAKNHILGFYGLQLLSETKAELDGLFIEPSFIGKGIGFTLFDHAVNQAKAMGLSTLSIQSDPNAAEFYQKVGAVQVGELESHSIEGRFLPLFEFNLNK